MSRADLEHYHGALVIAVAMALGRKPYEKLGYRARQRRLDQAGTLILELLKARLISLGSNKASKFDTRGY